MSFFLRSQSRWWQISFAASLLLPWLLMLHRTGAEIACAIVGIGWLAHVIATKDRAWKKDAVIPIALAAWGWLLASSLFAVDSSASLAVAAPWIRYILLYAALRHWLLVDNRARQFFCANIALLLVLLMLNTGWQYIHGISFTGDAIDSNGRLTDPLGKARIGIFVAKCTIIFFALYACAKVHVLPMAALLIAALATAMIAGERTAFLSLLIGLCAAGALLAWGVRQLRVGAIAGIAVLLFCCAVLLLSQPWVQLRAEAMWQTLLNYSQSDYGKLLKAGWLISQEHPFFGVGLKGFREVCLRLQESGTLDYCNLHPHNIYMEWLVETGAIGAMLFIGLVGVLCYQAMRLFAQHEGLARVVPAVMLGVWLVHFFPFMPTQSIFSNWPALLLWYSLGSGFAVGNLLRNDTK